jgi:Flp pilus assembly protein TadD
MLSRKVIPLVLTASSLLLPAAIAQQACDRRSGDPTTIKVQLSVEDVDPDGEDTITTALSTQGETAGSQRIRDYMLNSQIRVQLHDPLGGMLVEQTPNADGVVILPVCKFLTYRLRVIGPDIEETTLDKVEPNRGDKYLNVVLHKKGEKRKKQIHRSPISASGLKIPSKALKAFDKGEEAFKKRDLVEAEKYYLAAIKAYPDFEDAHNRMGIIYMLSGEKAKGRASFERALQINANYAPAHVNMAKVSIDERNFEQAYVFSQKALKTEPLNPGALFVAIESAYFTKRYQEAIGYTRTLHTLPHARYGLAHFFAGKALQQQQQNAPAVAEFQTFVQEDPTDPNALSARELMAYLQTAHVQ